MNFRKNKVLLVPLLIFMVFLFFTSCSTSNTEAEVSKETTNNIIQDEENNDPIEEKRFDKLTISEREERLKELQGKDITIGKLLEKIFPEMLEGMDKKFRDKAYSIKYDWEDKWAEEAIKDLKTNPGANLFIFLPED